jgi:hypothetical protein
MQATTEVMIGSGCFCRVLPIDRVNVHIVYALYYPIPPGIPLYFLSDYGCLVPLYDISELVRFVGPLLVELYSHYPNAFTVCTPFPPPFLPFTDGLYERFLLLGHIPCLRYSLLGSQTRSK